MKAPKGMNVSLDATSKEIDDAVELMENDSSEDAIKSVPTTVKVARKIVALHNSAKRRKLEFNLDYDDVAALLSAKTCYYLDVEFFHTLEHPLSRTIERIDGSKGYVKGNVVACTYRANQIKAALFESEEHSIMRITPEDLLKLLFRMKHAN